MELRKSEEPLPGRAVALILLLCVSGVRAETARYSVPEEAERGSFVANIAKDLGLTGEELSARQARLVPEGEKQYFQLNQHTGDLVVREQMDREELCGQSEPCLLRFQVLLESPLQSFRAEVSLTDINDHAPVFLNKEIVLKIPESVMPEARFLLESAQDPDVGNNSLQHYSISSNDYFHIYTRRRSDGRRYAELVLDRALDREQQAEVAFSVTAVDGGSPPRSGTALIRVVVLDINDNIPVFIRSLYKVRVLENSSPDTLVVAVSARDLDSGTNGEIAYSIVQNSEENRQTFQINSETGQIRLKKPVDYEETKTYEIDVQATDGGGLSAHCKVEVRVDDVNDNAPEVIITSLTSALSEAAPPATVVALFNVRDRDSGDNGRTSCELPGEQPFSITSLADDAYALVTSEPLDREQVAEYNVTVRARDEGSPALSASKTLFVRLLDVNDNAPTFARAVYTMVLSENEPAGTSLGRLSATDADAGENARVRYALGPPQPGAPAAASFVSVDAESGTVRTLRPLDYEEVRAFEVAVRAADGGSPPLSAQAVLRVVVRDENDNAPVVLHPAPDGSAAAGELVPRWAPAGYLVAKVVAVDADAGQNAWLSYELAKATEPALFRVGLHSGEVRTARAVAERDAPRQRLVVLVRDRGQPPRSATATLGIALVHGFSDAFLQISQAPVGRQQPQAVEEDLLTTYLIASLGCVSSLFLLSVLAFSAGKLCRARLRARPSPPSARCYADGDFDPDGVDAAGTGTLSTAYRYEACLPPGSGRSEFQFLRPVLPSRQSSAEAGAAKPEEPMCSSQPAGEREANAGIAAPPPVQTPDWAAGSRVHA
ncbi:protocadherin beta-16-like [Strix uralensis]|uniref:protocadherin beta-16-like n=1 Tax=Strix uralensis TaxID=36305 RepID=UPI003DA5E2F5